MQNMWVSLLFSKSISNIKNRLFIHSYIFKMDKAYLRYTEAATFDISFHLANPELKVNRRFNFTRKLDESVNTFLTRVTANVEKAINKKRKKKKSSSGIELDTEEITISACLLRNNILIENDTLCGNVFGNNNNSHNIILRLMDKEFEVVVNAPFVDGIALPNSILANFPVYATKFESVYTKKSLCDFLWYSSQDKQLWKEVGSGYIYIPSNVDIGSYLKLTCVPKNDKSEGPMVETITNVTVDASPGECPFEHRHIYTKKRCVNDQFRVVTYNILADLYCDSDFSRTVLYPYCPPYALNIDYRKQLVLKELLGYNGDIICLQEVDRKVYNHDLEPVFSSLNYGSNFMLKGGQVAEGLACFYNNNRFKFLETNSIILAEELCNNNQIFSKVWEKICTNVQLKERILNRTTALQTVALENIETSNIILVANTHLYFHPDADHIRLLQGYIDVCYIQNVYNELSEKYRDKSIGIIFCGDFNSVPECGIYQLYTTGTVPEDIIDFKSNQEESISGLNLSQNFKLASACGTPKYTNFTAGFQDCLDYIYYDRTKYAVESIIPLPTNEEIVQNTALPSIVFPSDHISLIADLKML